MTAKEAINILIGLRCLPINRDAHELENAVDMAIEALEKVEEYKRLEEQGLLLRTPIAEQTEIWTKAPFKDGVIRHGNVEVLSFSDNKLFSFMCTFNGVPLTAEFLTGDIGKFVFLTREEAERKLKEMIE